MSQDAKQTSARARSSIRSTDYIFKNDYELDYTSPAWTTAKGDDSGKKSCYCSEKAFDLATALLFNNVDHARGLAMYEALAVNLDVADAQCAAGVVLVEGLGCNSDEAKGLRWLRRAARLESESDSRGVGDDQYQHEQAMYEVGTCYYKGIEGYLEENEEKAL